MLLTVIAASLLVLFWASTAWLSRAETRPVALTPSGPYRLASAAGPIEVVVAKRPTLEYRATWLLSGPEEHPGADDGFDPSAGSPDQPTARSDVTLRCGTVMPCRAASSLGLPQGSGLSIEAHDNDVSVESFDGRLTIEVTGDGNVYLGPVAGTVDIGLIGGSVHGYGLTATDVNIASAEGEIELDFSVRPSRVTVRSGPKPVTIRLPDGDYAVNVTGGGPTAVAVDQAATADSEIFVQASGPVRIEPIS